MLYLDNNATTRPADEVVEAMADALRSAWANPSSVHRAGQEARARIELARRAVADLIGARPRSITFTSGGTEAIDAAVRGALLAAQRPVLATTPVEHAAVRDLAGWLAQGRGAPAVEVRHLPIDPDGVVDADAAADLIGPDVGVVSVQWVNNETGAVQPVERIGRLCRERGVVFHCDATQWVGKMPADVADASDWIDLLTFAPHKFHGPKGIGVLYARQGVRLVPTLHGAQETGRRGGTENVPGIVGAGVAAELARRWLADDAERERLAALRDRLASAVLQRVPDAKVNGPRRPGARVWNTTNIAFPRLEAEAMLLLLSERGVCASAGAACSSGSLDPSPVLLAMGVAPEDAHGSIRLSLSRETSAEEVDEATEIIARCAARLRGSMLG